MRTHFDGIGISGGLNIFELIFGSHLSGKREKLGLANSLDEKKKRRKDKGKKKKGRYYNIPNIIGGYK